MTTQTFIRQTPVAAPAEDVFDWHAREGAIRRLSPPFAPLIILSKTPGVDTGTKVRLKIKTGPVFSAWDAVHTACEPGRMFRDTQIRGPFASWNHTHLFIPDGTGSILEDRIDFALPAPLSFIGPINRYVTHDLARIFAYRHAVTVRDLALFRKNSTGRPLNIAVTGSGGLIGSRLVPFLTTSGHTVSTLVRRKPDPDKPEIFWDPDKGLLDPRSMEGFDVVIHLAGENIGEVFWTEAVKARLIENRVRITRLLSETLAGLKRPPHVFLCASAIGFYGDATGRSLDESAGAGNQFISRLCRAWEEACAPAVTRGIRTVTMRIGVVCSPEGGALSRLLPLFRLGLGAVMGSGRQDVSWISPEDVLYAMHHLITTPELSGPVNLTAPHPVTHRELTRTLSRLLRRPAPFRIPEWLIRARFGRMGEEILLSGSRIVPKKLLDSGYRFIHPNLTDALAEVLGVTP
ncbi:TIGR01777 family oxidoreductase [Desulfatiferula olefinivorans]